MNTSARPCMKSARPLSRGLGLASLGLIALHAAPVRAEPAPAAGVLTLSATATAEVPRDWMTLSFSVTREGPDAAGVQTQLKQALDAALAEARRVARPGQLEPASGGFSIYPRYGSKGQINGWQGSTQLVVAGRDMAAIAQLSGRITSMAISGVQYGLSREAREAAEAEVTAQAIARFRLQADGQSRAFGYAGWAVREVQVMADSAGQPMPAPRVAMAMAKVADESALPTEAGKGTVSVTVQGSVQMK